MKHFLLKASGILLAASVIGCADPAYDIDKLDTAAHFGSGDINLPLGSTDKITVGELIGDEFDEWISKNSNGTYSISYGSDPYDLSFAVPQDIDRSLGLKRYKGRYIDIEYPAFSKPSGIKFDENGVADLSSRIAASRKIAERGFRLPFTIEKMPAQLEGLSSVLLTDDSQVKITFSIPDCLLTEGTVTPDIRFDLHELFEVAGYPDGVVTFNDLKLNSSNGYSASKVLNLKKIVINPDNFNRAKRTLDINAHIGFSGNILVDKPKTTKARYQETGSSNPLIIRVQLVNVLCKGVEGQFTYGVDSIRSRLKLTKVAQKFGGDDTPVTFTSPELHLTYSSNFSVPTRAVATFVAQRDGQTTAQVKNVPFDLPVSTNGATVKRVYRFCSNGKSAGGAVGVKADIPSLFKPFPDIIYVYLDIATDNTKTGIVELDKEYDLQVALDISSPLGYGPGLKLEYSDSFPLPTVFGDILKENRLKLVGDITNTSPLKLGLDFVMTDEAGNQLTQPVSQEIAAGGTTPVEIDFGGAMGASAKSIAKGVLILNAAPTSSGKAINANDYIQADLKIQVPDGFYFSF